MFLKTANNSNAGRLNHKAREKNKARIGIRLMLITSLYSPLNPASADELARHLKDNQITAPYLTPTAKALEQAASLFAEELAGKPGAWQTLGMQRTVLDDSGGALIDEPAQQRQGRGLYALRGGAYSGGQPWPWLLQAPHSKDDAHTGVLTRQLFTEGAMQAAMWNSVGRHTAADDGGEADLAHLERSYWQAMTQAFAARHPQGRIIQLHGFDADKRKTDAAQGLDMIVSAGQRLPPQWVRQTAQCLKTNLVPYAVGLYPDAAQELGGTRNAQGILLRNLGHQGFLHVEMSLALREKLVKDQPLRHALMDCLQIR